MTKPLIALAAALALSACNSVAYAPPPSFDMPAFNAVQPVPSVATSYAPVQTLDLGYLDAATRRPVPTYCLGFACN